MADSLETIVVQIKADIAGLKAGMSEAHHSISQVGEATQQAHSHATELATGLLAFEGAKAIFEGVAEGVKSILEAVNKDQAAQTQLNAVLASTHEIAGVTAEAANQLADSLSGVTRFSKDAVLSTEDMLLTFTQVGQNVMPGATEAVLNMSQALGEDTKNAAIQLGKALNDPIHGITALHRVGVEFTEGQKEQIAAMVKAGDVMGAQKIILAELNTEFGGSARAAGTTFAGAMDIMGHKVEEAKVKVDNMLLPALTQLATFASGMLTQALSALPAIFDGLGVVWQALSGDASGLMKWFNQMGPAMGAVGTFITNLIANYRAFFDTLAAGGDPLKAFGDLIGGNLGALGNLIGSIAAVIGQALPGIFAAIGSALPGILQQLGQWGQAFLDWIGPMIPPMLAKLGEMAAGIASWVGQQAPIWLAQLGAWAQSFINWVGPMIPPLLAKMGELAGQFLNWIGQQVGPLVTKLGEWAKSFIDWVVPAGIKFLQEWPGVLNKFLDWIGTNAGPILLQLGKWALSFIGWIAPMIPPFLLGLAGVAVAISTFVVETAATLILKLVEWGGAFLDWVGKDVLPKLPGVLQGILDTIGGWIKGAVSWAVSNLAAIGQGMIDGIVAGLKAAGDAIKTFLLNLISGALDAVKNFFGIHSPSTYAALHIGIPLGEGIVAGLAQSLQAFGPTMQAGISAGMGVGRPISIGLGGGVGIGSGGPTSGSSGGLGRGGDTHMHLYIDGRELSQALAVVTEGRNPPPSVINRTYAT